MEFNRLEQNRFKSKSAIIAGQILQMIKSGKIPAGAKLPPERIIGQQMGASRPSVREAMSALQIVGIIETRPGDGTYVSVSSSIDDLTRQAFAVLESSDSPYEVLQARKAFESGILRLAIEVASDEDLDRIRGVWKDRSNKGRLGEYEAYSMKGKDFHMAIAKATQNRLIVNIMEKLLELMNQPLWLNMRRVYYEQDPRRIEEMIAVHERIVEAVMERNTEAAIAALNADLDNVLEQLYNGTNEAAVEEGQTGTVSLGSASPDIARRGEAFK